MHFEDLSPGEQLYYELSTIVKDDIQQLPKKQRKQVIMRLLEQMIDAVKTGQFPSELQLKLLDDIDINVKGCEDLTNPLRATIIAALEGKPFPGLTF
jgi:hypothetical protein